MNHVNEFLVHALNGPFYRIPFGPTVLLAYLAAGLCVGILIIMAGWHDMKDGAAKPSEQEVKERNQSRWHLGYSLIVYLGAAITLPYTSLYEMPVFLFATAFLIGQLVMCNLLMRKHGPGLLRQMAILGQIVTVAIIADLYANCPALIQSELFFRQVNSLALWTTTIYVLWIVAKNAFLFKRQNPKSWNAILRRETTQK